MRELGGGGEKQVVGGLALSIFRVLREVGGRGGDSGLRLGRGACIGLSLVVTSRSLLMRLCLFGCAYLYAFFRCVFACLGLGLV